jgi:acyl-CoA reductase-like NAD-dependent aldehyde dehydrogenase
MTDTKPYTDEAMALWNAAVDAATGNAVKWKPKANQSAAAVITAAMAEKDAEIAR